MGNVDAVTEFEVKIRLLNTSYADLVKPGRIYPFRPGMTASVEIITQTKSNVLAVPLAAVTTRDMNKKFNDSETADEEKESDENKEEDKKYEKSKANLKEVVFIHAEGKAVMREVKTGISDFDYIEILEGVKEGEEIIAGPFSAVSKKLKDGDMVKKAKKNKEK
jgi:HlyD family secretion protein